MKPFPHRIAIFIRKSIGLFAFSALVGSANALVLDFNLLTSGDATGRKAALDGNPSDWLVFTGDDDTAGYNPNGAVSHNFADLGGNNNSIYNMSPALTGTLSMELTANGSSWNVALKSLNYTGQANTMMFMNQNLLTPESIAALGGSFNTDGIGNSGTWDLNTWDIQYNMDFYLTTNGDGDPSPTDVDGAFDNASQVGYLLPVELLTATGSVGLSLNDPSGMFAGDFVDYLVTEIAPRLPANASYVLVTQMDKTHPSFASSPLSPGAYIGNTTIAWTSAVIPEPSSGMILAFGGSLIVLFKKRLKKS
ncbi:MAG: hypothetical protein ACK5NG_06170 [Chthoniobacterales bacterium]